MTMKKRQRLKSPDTAKPSAELASDASHSADAASSSAGMMLVPSEPMHAGQLAYFQAVHRTVTTIESVFPDIKSFMPLP